MTKRGRAELPEKEDELRFNDEEPVGTNLVEQHPTQDSQLPPITTGADSTKPTAFDRLPWKKVHLPRFIADGLSFDPDGGGLLGLEELDGSVWETIKQASASSSTDPHLRHKTEPPSTDHEQPQDDHPQKDPPKPQTTTVDTVDKHLRKIAKKARLAQLRQSKHPGQLVPTKPLPADTVEPQKPQPLLDELLDIDWAAAADLDGMSDMEGDSDNQFTMAPFDDSLLPGWSHLSLANPLKRALHRLSFPKPTPVQDASLPTSLSSDPPRDLVVIAETGSGKTLAYALPIINALILSSSSSSSSSPTPPSMDEPNSQVLPIVSLILTPTRELCLQVKSHIDTFLKAMCSRERAEEKENEDELAKNRTGIITVSICGGIAMAKQRKQLERSKKLSEPGRGGLGCVVVATPGRLWDLIQTWDDFAEGMRKRLDWLVVDEADKMIEKGQFEEVEKILKLTKRPRSPDHQTQGEDQMQEDGLEENRPQDFVKHDIRTMVFSATMDKNLQINLKKNSFKKKNFATVGPADPMQDLLEQIDFRDPQPELIDLTPEGRMVSGLKECKIECVLKDKDLYLYHFLLRYTGRTIVFLSSISALRRLAPIFTLLLPRSTILTLHSEMQQRSRLNSIDKFKSNPNSILLSTDVAARGLDIPQVEHVIHYQVPRTTDCYVHRSGRTARAGKGGVALALIGPDELKIWRNLMKNLGRQNNLPSPPIEYSISNKLKELLELAKKIDNLEHQSTKQSHEKNWLKKTAQVLEIELDSDDGFEDDSRPARSRTNQSKGDHNTTSEAKVLRNELKLRLSDPLIIKNNSLVAKARGRDGSSNKTKKMSGCFIKDYHVVEQFLNNQNHHHLVGLDRCVNAIDDLSAHTR